MVRLPSGAGFVVRRQLSKGLFSFADQHSRNHRQLVKHLPRPAGHLRAAQPDGNFRKHSGQIPYQRFHHADIPDIAGKRQHIRLSPVKIGQDPLRHLVDGIFRQFDPAYVRLLFRIGLQAVNPQIGVDILGVDRGQQQGFHCPSFPISSGLTI